MPSEDVHVEFTPGPSGYEFIHDPTLPPLPGIVTGEDGELYWDSPHQFAPKQKVDIEQLVKAGYILPVYETTTWVVWQQSQDNPQMWTRYFSSRHESEAREWYAHFVERGPGSAWKLVKTVETTIEESADGG